MPYYPGFRYHYFYLVHYSSLLVNCLGKYPKCEYHIIYIYNSHNRRFLLSPQNRNEGFEENGECLAVSCFKFRHNDDPRSEHNSRVSKGEEFLI